MRVLVIDDCPTIGLLIGHVIEVDRATKFIEALVKYDGHEIVFIDHTLDNGHTGDEVIEFINKYYPNNKTTFIGISAEDKGYTEKFLKKPFAAENIITTYEEAIEEKQSTVNKFKESAVYFIIRAIMMILTLSSITALLMYFMIQNVLK
jgi:CheY-like chemotaxis protein